MSKLTEYIRSRGLAVNLVAQKAGITRQALSNYGVLFTPTARTLTKVAAAMTELGVKTKIVDLVEAME